MKNHTAFVFVALLCILAASAHAESSYRFEVYGSGIIPRDKNFEISSPQSVVPVPGKLEFSPGVRGGIRVGTDGLRHWGQDITYSYGINAAKINLNPFGEFAFTSRSHQFAYNAIYYPIALNRSKVVPYVTAGGGGTIFTVSKDAINQASAQGLGTLTTHTTFTFNAGGGVRIQATDVFGIRFDVRDWMSHPPRYGIPESSTDPLAFVLPVNGVFHQVEFSFGLVFRFRNYH